MAEAKSGGTSIELVLENVRLSFPYLFTARVNEDDDGKKTKKFQAKALLDKKKNKALIDEVWDAIDDVIEAKWGERPAKLKDDKLCLRDGDDEDLDGYDGCMYVSASNSKRPTVVGRDKQPLVEEDGKPYAGCYVNMIVRIWAQDNKFGKRVNASLEAVQFLKDGEAFGAPPVDWESKFKDYGGDDEDEGRSRRRKRARDDDDDDDGDSRRSRRSRSRRDEDEEDDDDRSSRRSRRRRSRDDDDDED